MLKIVLVVFFAFFSFMNNIWGQQIDGRVLDENKHPVVGATINIKNTQVGVITSLDGSFSIKAIIGDTLIFRYIGKKTKELKIENTDITVILESLLQEIDEVVITGYEKVKSRVFTGATTSVKMRDIMIEGVTDVARMLEGRVPGLNIQNVSGTFGSSPRITIRGGASISSNVTPLWVIDGSVYEDIISLTMDQLISGDAVTLISSAITGINPSDIEDIQVLKDASATSMYGARALNGVIVVSTKEGKRNSANKISYSYDYTIRNIPTYSDYNLLNSQETMSIYQEMQRKGYLDIYQSLYGRRGGVYYQMYSALNTWNNAKQEFNLVNTFAKRIEFLRTREYANTDWFKELFRMAPTQNHSITFMGGGKNTSNYASLGFYTDGGWTLADKVNRITANLKNTFFINEAITSKFILQGNFRKQRAPGSFNRRINYNIGSFERDFDINPFMYALNTSRTLRSRNDLGELEYYRNNWAPFNILNEYDNNYIEISLIDFKIQGELDYKLSNNFKIKGLVSIRKAVTTNSHYVNELSNAVMAFRANENTIVANDNIYLFKKDNSAMSYPEVAFSHGGIFNKTENNLDSYLGRISLDYNKSIEEHDIKLFGFSEVRYTNRTINPFSGYGIQYLRGNQVFTDPNIFDKLLFEGENYFSLTTLKERGITFSANFTYGYKGRYIFNSVINYEGSNISGKGAKSRWLPTWNIGMKWNIHKEDFMMDVSAFSKLALRVSYGLTAKINENAINSLAVFKGAVTNRLKVEDREPFIDILHLENRDLTWEKMYELNLGLDAGLFNNRVSVVLDLYRRNAFDLIDLIRTSGVGGQYYKYANFGDMQTKGVEFSVFTKNIEMKDFSWSSSITGGYYSQKITRLLNNPTTFDMIAGNGRGNLVGYPRGSLFSFKFTGLQKNGLPTFDFGKYPFQDISNSNVVGADFLDINHSKSYLEYNGPIEPNFTGGISNTFRYKDIELSFFVSAQLGNKIRLQPSFDPLFADLNVFSKDYYDRWLVAGDEKITNVPVIPSKDLIKLIGRENIERAYNTYNYSNIKYADGSFIRLKSISLSYNLPKDILKRMKISNLSLKLQGTNLFLLYSDKHLRGQDPEFYRTGGVSSPIFSQYTLSFNVVF